MEKTTEDQTATPLELFFDLVFVFGLTQVTAYMAHPTGHHVPDWLAVTQGVLVMALLWWAWVGYSWLTNLVRADEGVVRLVLMAAMGGAFVIALAIPEAFHDMPGGLDGPWVIVVAYFAFRITHIVLFWIYARGDRGLRGQLLKFAPTLLLSTLLLSCAAVTEDAEARALCWAAALVGEYVGTLLGGASGWRLRSVSHFAERHGLMVIIALGESIVAIGVGATELPISWPIIGASVLGLALASGLWWIYFDITALHAEHSLAAAPDDGRRTAMARDAYSVLHLPMMIGIVVLALGLKKFLGYLGEPGASMDDAVHGLGFHALYGGVALYLLGHVAFKLRTTRVLSKPRVGAVLALGGAWLTVRDLPALVQLGTVVALVWALVGFETWRYAEQRRELRHAGHGHHEAGAHLADGSR